MDRRLDNRRTGDINIYICSEGPDQDCNAERRPRFAGGTNSCDESDEWLRKATRKDCEQECTCFRSPAVKLECKKKACKMPKSKDCCKGKCKSDCKALKKEKKKSKKCKDVATGRARAVGKRLIIQNNQCQESKVDRSRGEAPETSREPPTRCCCEPVRRDVCCCNFEEAKAEKNCTRNDDEPSDVRKNCFGCSRPGLECTCRPGDVGYEQCTCKLRTLIRKPNRALLCHDPDFRRFWESYQKVISEFKRKVNAAKNCRVCRETRRSPPRCFEESGQVANGFQTKKKRKPTCSSVARLPSKIQLAKNVNLLFKRPRPKCYYCKKSPCKCDVFKRSTRPRKRKVYAYQA